MSWCEFENAHIYDDDDDDDEEQPLPIPLSCVVIAALLWSMWLHAYKLYMGAVHMCSVCIFKHKRTCKHTHWAS